MSTSLRSSVGKFSRISFRAVPVLDVVEQGRDGHAGTTEDRLAAGDAGVADHNAGRIEDHGIAQVVVSRHRSILRLLRSH
jgi:hypothetical protein